MNIEMNKEIIVTNYEDFVCQLYKAIKEAAESGTGLQLQLSPYDCVKWSNEQVSYIECS